MRPLPLLALALVVSAATAAVVSLVMVPSVPTAQPDASLDARVARLEAEPGTRPAPRPVRRRPASAPSAPVASGTAGPAPGPRRAAHTPRAADDTPRAFLDRYLRSFDRDPKGSEFFRLAVEAFAPEMVDEIAAVVVDPDRPHAARTQLAGFLGAPVFRRDPAAVRALVDSLRASPSDELAATAFAGLRSIGDAGTALELEALAPFLERDGVRRELFETVAVLAQEGANAALLRMLPGARSGWEQREVVGALRGDDPASALAVIAQASRMEVQVRNRAAEKLGELGTREARGLLEAWLAREEEPSVRARLVRARADWDAVPKYSAQRMVGPPDVENPAADDVNAWCPRTKNGGREWIRLTYAEPLVATHVRVYEVYTGGAVVSVEVEDEYGEWHVGWEGRAPERPAGTFEVKLRPLDRPVKRVRVTLDTSVRDGWHEIDAVELVGPGGSAWAAEAVASTTYGTTEEE